MWKWFLGIDTVTNLFNKTIELGKKPKQIFFHGGKNKILGIICPTSQRRIRANKMAELKPTCWIPAQTENLQDIHRKTLSSKFESVASLCTFLHLLRCTRGRGKPRSAASGGGGKFSQGEMWRKAGVVYKLRCGVWQTLFLEVFVGLWGVWN